MCEKAYGPEEVLMNQRSFEAPFYFQIDECPEVSKNQGRLQSYSF